MKKIYFSIYMNIYSFFRILIDVNIDNINKESILKIKNNYCNRILKKRYFFFRKILLL
jgi:hypothetical protein